MAIYTDKLMMKLILLVGLGVLFVLSVVGWQLVPGNGQLYSVVKGLIEGLINGQIEVTMRLIFMYDLAIKLSDVSWVGGGALLILSSVGVDAK